MLFVNFLCLLYLMLLVNGLTVSKNIDNSYFDERVDSLHDLEFTPRYKSKHDKFLHKNRRIKSGVATPTSKVTVRVTTPHAKSTETTYRSEHFKLHKSTKRRIGGFWRKFKIKEDKAREREKRLKYQLKKGNLKYERPLYGSDYEGLDKKLVTKRRKNTYTISFKKKKREVSHEVPKILNKQKDEKKFKNVEVNITPYAKFNSTVKETTHMKAISTDEELKNVLNTMTTKVAELKHLYGLEKYKPIYTSTHKVPYTTKHTTTQTTTENLDVPGTAQLEALLNDIKEKSLHLIVEQNPDFTDLITNTVTEATFEADPLLTHLEINSPAFSLYTFITLNSDFGKRDANITKSDDEKGTVIETSTNYNREGRSVAEDAMTAAQSIEDILQKEMKNIYKKVKNKVSGDFRKEVDKVKTTLKPQSKKTCSKDRPTKQHTTTKPTTETNKKPKSTPRSLQNRVDRKSGKHTKITEQEITTTPTADDYALLTLYEQMLTKTCQNNIMNMRSSQERIKRNKRNKKLVSNRNFETLFDQNLKEDVKKLYEDREEIPDDLEYNFEVNIPEISTAETATEPNYSQTVNNGAQTQNEMDDEGKTEMTPYDDNSYEGLSSKISYNEFVNGYKHYLNFQKDQANDKFSNLIRYQAHRHHSVDDIGKYILNKIPQLPSRDKRFFEYEDDHDSSTKSEESWFKKHFYMFIDNGTPKKYHTSQTVSLKSPTPNPFEKSGRKMEEIEKSELEDKLKVTTEAEDNAVDISLEKLSQVLEEHKASPAALPVQENAFKDSILKNAGKRHGHIFKSFTPPHIINMVFGKEHKTLEGIEAETNNQCLVDNSLDAGYLKPENNKNINFLFANESNRKKRNTKDLKEKPTTFDEKLKFQTKKSAKLINLTKKKPDNAKVGCVDVGLVVPPTAIVNLKGTKRKEGKLKKLLQKLHLSRSNKKAKREYRNIKYTRKQRSNPFQKLKNIFKSTPKSKVLKSGSHLSDYDIMSSHIDTFKPLKYDKVLNIEEMKKQIPNITGEMAVDALPKYVNRVNSWNARTTEKAFTDFTAFLNTTLTSLPMNPATNLPPIIKSYNKFPTTKPTKKIKSHNIENLLKINVETKSSSRPYNQIISFPQHMPLNDIRDQVENIFIKITSDPSNEINPTFSTSEAKYLISNKMGVNKDALKLNLNSFYTKIPEMKIYSKENSIVRPNSEIHTILDLEQNSEFIEDDSYIQTFKPKFNINEVTAQSPLSMLIPTESLLTLGRSVHDDEKEKYKPYPDYFSDLLMWNKDILNSDKVPTPWRDILKNMNRELDYTTPDISDIQQELIKINDGSNSNVNSFKETPILTNSHEGITPRNWLQSVDLEKPPIGKSILIEQEKKFVKFNPKITDRHLKAADFVNELNKFAKTLSDETKYKLNKLHAVPENYLGNKENKDQSAILVDTTLLAYDDDVNYISTLTPRELSKNALKTANVENSAAASLKAKTNKQPLQYFATPLPMKMTEFQEFLKANKIDVESVTSPIVDLPTINAYSSKKSSIPKTIKKVRPSITKKKQKSTRIKTKLKSHERRVTKGSTLSIVKNMRDSENQFDYLNDLEHDIFSYYNFEEKDRFKRYNDVQYNGYFTNLNQDTNQWNKVNKGMQKHKPASPKPFTNKEHELKSNDIAETTEDMTPKDFEITIINFGDINKLTDEYAPIQTEITTEKTTEASYKLLKNAVKTPLSVDFIEKGSKDSEFLHKLHNDLFYDHAYTKSKETTTAVTETIKIEETTMPTPPLAFHEAVWKKMPIKPNNVPKRVRISSQSYKYDIIYHHPEKNKKDRGTHLPSYIITTEVTTPEELYPSYNSDFASAGEYDVARGDCGKKRPVRKVKISSEKSATKTKDSPTSTKNPKTKKHLRHHKLKRFFPVIQDKLRIFSKNSSTYSDFLQKPSTIILSSSSVNSKEKTTKKGNIKNTDTEVLYDEKVDNDYYKNDNGDAKRMQTKRVYVDFDASHNQKTTKISNITDINNSKDYINKREVQSLETHTAKDVAALEVIVDMMKNPLKCDENNKKSPNIRNDKSQNNDKVNANTNSIQVHIAVPYEIENCKKRSLEAVKVRKVFTAKLSTPVDIEYQVHSFEGPPTTQKPLDDTGGLSPGVYLLIDNTYFPQGVALKPVIPNNMSAMKVRQIKTTTAKMTSTIPTKNLAKVTLSKDFISAINKQLITLYNLTRMDKSKRDVANDTQRDRTRRSINWDVVSKIFGHDRVCNCKCKVNKTMCKACAASEAVMSELIFEFENLFKYMNDHCTEIQAYFVANPRGGKRLKDSVHKIDQNLRDYYKRVKGKCQGRTCITFATLIDERELHKHHKRSKDAGHNFINDLEAIAKDIEKATKTVTCSKENLEDEVKKLKHIINNCILLKSHDKRSDFDYRQSKDIKTVYSLDSVNVNIICNTESTIPYITSVSPHNTEKNFWSDTEYKEKNSKGFKQFFSRFRKRKKDNAFGEYLKQMNKTFDKREVKENKIESPLISDTGGSFWHDYIRRCSGEPKLTRKSGPKIESQTKHERKAFAERKEVNMEFIKKEINNNTLATTAANTGDVGYNKSNSGELINNINQFLKHFGNADERQITDYTEKTPPHNQTTYKTKTKKIKYKKPKCKVHKTVKTKMHKINSTNEINIPKKSKTSHGFFKIETTPINIRITKTLNIFKIKSMFKTTKQMTTESTTVTNTDFFKKIKMVTANFLKKIGKTNISLNTVPIKREHNLSTSTVSNTKLKPTYMISTQSDINVISEVTTESNPNIIIIDDTDELTNNNYKDLLLSIIDYESNKLNKEWMRFANVNLDKIKSKQTTAHNMTTKKSKIITRKKDSTDNYDILQDLGPLFPAKSNEIETTISMSALIDKIGSKFKLKFANNHANTRSSDYKTRARKKPAVGKKSSPNKITKTPPHTTSIGREAVDSTAEPRICNMKATRQHILDIRREMPLKDFEEYIANVSCQKYESLPKAIFLGKTRYNDNKDIRKWNWIRDRRSIFRSKSKPKGTAKRISRVISAEFEVFYRGEHGIYKQQMRRKRCVDDSRNYINELRNLPRFHDSENEIYALAGDTVNISCFDDSEQSFKDRSLNKYAWKAERDGMLDYNNVVVDGDVVNIVDVQAKNSGYYICKSGGKMKREIKLAVLTLPNLIILSTLLYRKETECTHDDLTRLKLLGPEISKEIFQRQSYVNIDNPVCLEDKADGKIKIKGLASVDCRRPAVDCSVSCRRDLQSAFASICAENVPALATIGVVLLRDGVNYTWRPSKYHKRSIITRSLRDFANRHDVQYPSEPGSLNLLVSCPAGYRLLSRHKVCAPCSENTYAREGDNACSVCPRGSCSAPGADRCRAANRSRRYDWWICPPCGYGVAALVALCCCGVCVALALLVQLTSRSCGTTDNNAKESSELPTNVKGRMNPGPTRSSRVILAKFFKPSLTSSMATDSQETKFDTWKARNHPPPLPPVDFDS